MTNTAIVATHAFEPSNPNEAFTMATRLVASRLLPKAVSTPEAAFAIIVTGRELGLTAMQSLRGIHIIEGKPVLAADTMLALARRSSLCAWFRISSSNEACVCETQRAGELEPTKMAFTIEDAKTAQLLGKDNWKKYPAAMLRARAIAAICRAVYPDIFMGVYDPDELGHSPVAAPVTVATTVVDVDVTAREFMARIVAAATLDELASVGRDIRGAQASLDKDGVRDLRAAYDAKRASLDIETPAPPPAPASGSDVTEAAAQ